MNEKFLLALAAVCFASAVPMNSTLMAAERSAASASTGISGRVKNAATDQYLSKARVSVKGTDQVTYTDDFGEYHLVGVPSGAIVLDVFYTDFDPQAISLTVINGQSIEQDVELTSRARYGQDGRVVKLDPFLVGSNKETDAQAIATNA